MNKLKKCFLLLVLSAVAFADDPPWSEYGYCKMNFEGGYGLMSFGQCREMVMVGNAECWLGNLQGPQDSSIPCG